ncbi:MAG: hydrolase [Ignavibacteria bacterium RBG_16_34_14]|nr:MAG: hydrolase [Ignavibacteria bacterium RBG_16_34_14]
MKDKFNYRKSFRIKILLGLVTVLAIAFMFPRGESIESEVAVGSIWIHDDLIAPFSFPVIKDEVVYHEQLHAAEQSVYPVYLNDRRSSGLILDSLNSYNVFLIRTIDETINSDTSSVINPTFLSTESFNAILRLRRREVNLLQGKEFNLKTLFDKVQEILSKITNKGILSEVPEKDNIAVREGNVDKIETSEDFFSINEASQEVIKLINKTGYSSEIKSALAEYATHFVFPNLIFSREQTAEEIEQVKNNVSRYTGIVNENERIIAKHDRVTKEAKLKIDSYKIAKGENIGEEGFLIQILGNFLHITSLITLLTIYLFLFRKRIFHDNQKILLISVHFLFIAFITYLINNVTINAPMQYLIFVPAASMLLTIVFDSRVGFYSTVIMVLIAGALRGNDYTFVVMNLFAGALAVYTVRDIKNRSQIFRSFLFILSGYTLTVIGFGLERFASWDNILVELAFAGSNALISPVLTYGLLIFFERLFKITTDLTLLELSNFDKPLLKDLSRKAPGTFNHSMTLGTLGEAAAEKIGANPLLTRVGAYYHDIGKTLIPQNFVENQLNNRNIHEDLSPEQSVKLILQHVTEGKKLAEEYAIPKEIIDFIPMHHGTMTMSFFYEKAKKLYGDEKVDIIDYRYPGPKPNTKETVIIMLADSCESAVRSIEDPDSVKVENVIDNIFKARIEDGQLDESPITFNDINKIKEAFITILLGQHHKRIKYPKQEEIEKGE